MVGDSYLSRSPGVGSYAKAFLTTLRLIAYFCINRVHTIFVLERFFTAYFFLSVFTGVTGLDRA